MKKHRIQNGDHFWAKVNGKLCVLTKDKESFYICGGWEGAIDDFEFIQFIELPKGYTKENLYYLNL